MLMPPGDKGGEETESFGSHCTSTAGFLPPIENTSSKPDSDVSARSRAALYINQFSYILMLWEMC